MKKNKIEENKKIRMFELSTYAICVGLLSYLEFLKLKDRKSKRGKKC